MEYLIFIGILLALSIAMAMDMSWNNVLTNARNEMVFADRHRDYGAFVLRRDYTKRLILAVIGSVLAFGLADRWLPGLPALAATAAAALVSLIPVRVVAKPPVPKPLPREPDPEPEAPPPEPKSKPSAKKAPAKKAAKKAPAKKAARKSAPKKRGK